MYLFNIKNFIFGIRIYDMCVLYLTYFKFYSAIKQAYPVGNKPGV